MMGSLSWMERLLTRLARGVYHYPRWFFYPQVILFAVCVVYTIVDLKFDTSRNNLVGSDKKYHRIFLNYKKEFQGQDDIVVVVESEKSEKNRQFVERLGSKLEQETNTFTAVFYKGDLKMMGHKALFFLTEGELKEFKKTLDDYRPFIQNFARATNLNGLFRLVNQQFRTAKRETNAENDSLIKALPAFERIVKEAADGINRPGTPPSPGLDALFGGNQETERSQYIVFATNRIYLVTARAKSEDLNGAAVERLRELVKATQAEVPGINVGITGEPVLEFDEMAQSQYDSTVATIVSLIIVALIFIYGYNETGRPLKATASLIIGIGYTMGFTTLVVGHLNILTITFVPMLIGLAIDFGVHLISRYEEELRHGRSEWEAIEKAMVNTGMGIFTGCLTTSGAFLAMGITDFKGIQEMGVICGGGLLVCLVPMMTVLPVLLLRGRQNVLDHTHHEGIHRARLERVWLDRPWPTMLVTALLCAASIYYARKVYFDYNLLHMQSEGLPAVEFEHKLITSTDKSVLYGAVVADSLPKAVTLEERIRKLPSVSDVESMSKRLAEDQTEKMKLIGQIRTLVANMFNWPETNGVGNRLVGAVDLDELDDDPVDTQDLRRTLTILISYLELASKEVRKEGDMELLKQLQSLESAITDFRNKIRLAPPEVAAQKLADFQMALFKDIRGTFAAIKDQDASSPLQAKDLPTTLRDRFIGVTGKHLLMVYPKDDVWQRDKQETFVKELETVDPDVTGTPVQLYHYTTLLKDSYVEAAWYSLGAIALMVLIHFRSPLSVVLSLLPVAVGTLWMVGYMGWRGIGFNPANIMTLPLVIGIGVTSGIHILNRFSEETDPSIFAKSTGKAVLVSALTTVAGFGSLVMAKHRGIASLGEVMAVGTATCMLAAVTFLPALMKLLMAAGWKAKKPSGDQP